MFPCIRTKFNLDTTSNYSSHMWLIQVQFAGKRIELCFNHRWVKLNIYLRNLTVFYVLKINIELCSNHGWAKLNIYLRNLSVFFVLKMRK